MEFSERALRISSDSDSDPYGGVYILLRFEVPISSQCSPSNGSSSMMRCQVSSGGSSKADPSLVKRISAWASVDGAGGHESSSCALIRNERLGWTDTDQKLHMIGKC